MHEANTPHRRHCGLERVQLAQQLKASYENGATIRSLRAETQLSYGKVHRLLAEAGTTFRSRGG
nr:helix-turn-helix domain-containing protein [Saccharopolyspora gloriosae]